jgi:hypothetical protein
MESYGFIYVWRDRKKNRYYVGAHWGNEEDGYVCSSAWMKQAYKRRPKDFVRRVVERFSDRSTMNEREHRWLQMIKPEELKGTRYYNMVNHRFGHWSNDERSRMTVGQKISASPERAKKIGDANRGRVHSAETREKWSKARRGRSSPLKGKKLTDEHRKKLSESLTGRKLSKEHREKVVKNLHKYRNSGGTRVSEEIS